MESGGSLQHCSVVTGAFGFSGQEIAKLLLARGESVRTLTNHSSDESPLAGQIETYPLDFNNFQQLFVSRRNARGGGREYQDTHSRC
jgi:nucleoside-diphosphate-sugar epimerase